MKKSKKIAYPDSFKSKIPRIKSAFSVSEIKNKFDHVNRRKESGLIKYNLISTTIKIMYIITKNQSFRSIKPKKVRNIYH